MVSAASAKDFGEESCCLMDCSYALASSIVIEFPVVLKQSCEHSSSRASRDITG